tara:strand:+ start:2838 stop:3344 length:507 start_codon:yes stop_codon:yes gene_type:complete
MKNYFKRVFMDRNNKQRCDLLLDSLALDPDTKAQCRTLIHLIDPEFNQRLYRYTNDEFSTVGKETRTIIEQLLIPIKPKKHPSYIGFFGNVHTQKRTFMNGFEMPQSVVISLDNELAHQLSLFRTKLSVCDHHQAFNDCNAVLQTIFKHGIDNVNDHKTPYYSQCRTK